MWLLDNTSTDPWVAQGSRPNTLPIQNQHRPCQMDRNSNAVCIQLNGDFHLTSEAGTAAISLAIARSERGIRVVRADFLPAAVWQGLPVLSRSPS
jgi:hypothetical protein